MTRRLAALAPLVTVALVASVLAGCGATPTRPVVSALSASAPNVKAAAKARKETRAQAERRAQGYISTFNDTHFRSINSRTEQVQKIARTEADAAYDFLLQEIDDLQELRGEMPRLSQVEYEDYEEMLLGLLDELTPDQATVKSRQAKAEKLSLDLDELTITEELSTGEFQSASAHVGTRSRLLTSVQESKLYKATKKAYKNTKRSVKKFLANLKKKLRWS